MDSGQPIFLVTGKLLKRCLDEHLCKGNWALQLIGINTPAAPTECMLQREVKRQTCYLEKVK